MSRFDQIALLRMGERALIVLGGILSVYLGYKLFTLGINTAQGEAQAFGIVLRDFGPGLFFAALGAYVLVRALEAAIRTGTIVPKESKESEPAPAEKHGVTSVVSPAVAAATFFFGLEDTKRQLNKWSAKSFFLETRDLLRQLDAGNDSAAIEALKSGLNVKLDSITMTPEEYQRYKFLTNKADQNPEEQREFLELEGKLFP